VEPFIGYSEQSGSCVQVRLVGRVAQFSVAISLSRARHRLSCEVDALLDAMVVAAAARAALGRTLMVGATSPTADVTWLYPML
jgi:hypothetical protein